MTWQTKHGTGQGFPDLMTPAQVAEVLKVHAKTVTRWANEGKLDSVRTPGGHRRFERGAVEALLRGEKR